MNVAVLGLGLIGGSIGLAARARAGAVVSGYDPDSRALERARQVGAIDRAAAVVADAVAGADVVFVAAPVPELASTVRLALGAAPDGCVVSDVGSAKRSLLRELSVHGDDPRFIGGHPLAGSEKGGIENARGELFDGAAWCLMPGPAGGGRERLASLVESFGSMPVEIEPEAHDRLMARASHLPHVFANVLVGSVLAAGSALPGEGGVAGEGGVREQGGITAEGRRLLLSGPSFRDATRVAGASTAIWGGIYMANADMLVEAIDEATASLAKVRDALVAGDREALEAWNERARSEREALSA